MARPILLIADLHLDPSRPAATLTLQRFLHREAAHAEAIYILGDLFEAWIGDDAVADDEPILHAFRDAAEQTRLFVMHGNRDFLLGARFESLSGATLLPDPSVVDIHGEPVLLMHGDSLCTADPEYQQFRAVVRDPQWQAHFLALPIDERRAQARAARSTSQTRNQALDSATMDVTPEAVAAALAEHGVHQLIHGHTHRPGIHRWQSPDGPAARYVLGDWFDHGSLLRCLPGAWQLEELEHEPAGD